MKYKNILVTGGCGFIGSNFINYTLARYEDINIWNIDCLNYCADEGNVYPNSRYHFIHGNICDKHLISYILKEKQIDLIVHFAAQSHVDNSFGDSIQYTIDNIQGTHTLLECSRKYGKLKLFLHFSTDEVYGEVHLDHEGCIEHTILNPTNPYSATKAGAEMLVNSYHHSYGLPYIITRCNNVYGPNQYPEKLIPKFIKLLKENKKCTIHGKGDTRRNFIHTYDVSKAVDVILNSNVMNDIINIGSNNEYTVLEIAEMLVKKIKNEPIENWIEYVEDRPFNDFRYHVNIDKLKGLGWDEEVDFLKGLNALIETS
jgi:dTDP-glucose 4,6-dehydratase/UDP-glucose 4,6-dehydratase